jgi:hypothetical protein
MAANQMVQDGPPLANAKPKTRKAKNPRPQEPLGFEFHESGDPALELSVEVRIIARQRDRF